MNLILLCLSLVLGTWGIRAWAQRAMGGAALLNGVFALVAVLALNSAAYCVVLFLGLPGAVFHALSMLLAVAGLLAGRPWREASGIPLRPGPIGLHHVLLMAGLLSLTWSFGDASIRWGDWDAWAQWNLHARHLLNGAHWVRMMHPGMGWNHPDYPLMLPSLMAMFWQACGAVSPLVPALFAYAVLVLIGTTLYTSLSGTVARPFAVLAFLLLAFDSWFVHQASTQYADTLLAFFILLSVVLLADERAGRSTAHMLLFGLLAGACGWIKNEGLVFFLIVFAVAAVRFRRQPLRVLQFLLGASPMLVVILWFKLGYPFLSDLDPGGAKTAVSRILDPKRHMFIVQYFLTMMYTKSPFILPLLVIVLGLAGKDARIGFIALALLFLAYYVTYLITPYPLGWHLSRSCNRLVHHFVPAFLFLSMRSLASGSRLRAWMAMV